MILKSLSVTEVNNYVKRITDNDFILNNLIVKGEISNLKYHSSGHIYFSLKDESSKINCVMFRNEAQKLQFRLKDGLGVEVKCRLAVYIKEGSYQLYCNDIKEAGIGDLFIKFQKLKEELEGLGIFDEKHKKKLPSFPKRIGIVTSPTGAALQDIIKVIRRRNSIVDIVVYPALVQGSGAASTVIEGIKYFNTANSVDVIITGRGGGAIEELWAFNDRDLALTIFNSEIPVVSAVGHETDFTICDFVSDVRAATPSAAAEIVVPDITTMEWSRKQLRNKLTREIEGKLQLMKNSVVGLERILSSYTPENNLIHFYEKLDYFNEKLNQYMLNIIGVEKHKIVNLNNVLTALNPLGILSKGYAVVRDENMKVIRSVDTLLESNKINILIQDGNVNLKVVKDK